MVAFKVALRSQEGISRDSCRQEATKSAGRFDQSSKESDETECAARAISKCRTRMIRIGL
jgi:hypothetical protein